MDTKVFLEKNKYYLLSAAILLGTVFLIWRMMEFRSKIKVSNGETIDSLSVPDINGNLISLQSFHGKIVLLHFWASWCGPCRHEAPEVVQLYRDFHGMHYNGAADFEIFSISLDDNRSKWLNAIDNLNFFWENHGSELNGWDNSLTRRFQINSIPATLLLDENGKVIGNNLDIPDIRKILEERLTD